MIVGVFDSDDEEPICYSLKEPPDVASRVPHLGAVCGRVEYKPWEQSDVGRPKCILLFDGPEPLSVEPDNGVWLPVKVSNASVLV